MCGLSPFFSLKRIVFLLFDGFLTPAWLRGNTAIFTVNTRKSRAGVTCLIGLREVDILHLSNFYEFKKVKISSKRCCRSTLKGGGVR